MSLRILLIEDEDEIASFVSRGLREEGYSVERIAHGSDARREMQREWDVIILDWSLPGVEGIALLRQFRSQGRDTPVLMLTARDAVSDRVTGLATLSAIVEQSPDGWEWEPHGRSLIVGGATAADALPWCVSDDRGRIVDRSRPELADSFFRTLDAACQEMTTNERAAHRVEWSQQPWRARQRQFRRGSTPPSVLVAISSKDEAHDDDEVNSSGGPLQKKNVLPALTLTIAVSLVPMRDNLRRLIVTLSLVSCVIWLTAALTGHWLCRRALRPISTMAVAASAIDATRWNERLPIGDSRDELQELSRAFNGLLDRLQESFDRQKRFTGEASHQLRTPLTSMIGHVDVTLRRDRSPDEYRDTLILVRRQTDQLSKIIEALLFLARADSEAAPPEAETFTLADWLHDFAESWQRHPRAADLQFTNTRLEETTLHVSPTFLAEILNSLLHNACRCSTAETPVALQVTSDDTHIRFDVIDHGFGIANADLPNLFKPFFRSNSARLRGIPGTGLGLSIAQRMAHELNAILSVTRTATTGPTDALGSTFTLLLPRAPQFRAES